MAQGPLGARGGSGVGRGIAALLALVVTAALAVPAGVAQAAGRGSVAPPQDRWALLVGVTEYRGRVSDTVGGAADARLVADVLLRNGWRKDRIMLLTDGKATGRNIRAGLDWLRRNSSSRTFSLFHYSGHVKRHGGREHLWPVDNAYLADHELVGHLRGLRGASWTNITGCHAAGLVEGLASRRHFVTTSSRKPEKSYEDPRTGHSVWAGLLFDQGMRRGAADKNRDRRVSVGEAFEFAAPRATKYTSRQRKGAQRPVRTGDSRPLRLDAPRV